MMLFTVFGSPISHSLSPIIHQAFADQFGIDLTYTRTLASRSDFAEILTSFRKSPEAIGANITAPLKQLAFSLCHKVSTRAQLAESVNTLHWEKDKLIGDNTDGIGFEKAIYTHGKQTFEDQNILLLGAGGAALGILPIILNHSPKSLYIFNRTQERVILLCDKYNQMQSQEKIKLLTEKDVLAVDWVINTAGQFDLLENNIFKKIKLAGAKFFDLSYAQSGLTIFLEKAKSFRPTWMDDGLAMLVEQAAESFYVWHQRKPETTAVLRQIRSKPTSL
jgi:shikimate dehydrogenase